MTTEFIRGEFNNKLHDNKPDKRILQKFSLSLHATYNHVIFPWHANILKNVCMGLRRELTMNMCRKVWDVLSDYLRIHNKS